MDADAALAELLALSTQVVEAVVVGPDGLEAASTADPARGAQLAAAGTALLETAADVRPGAAPVDRVVVDLPAAAVIVVRDGERSIVATTAPEPTVGLVTYDLRAALRRLAAPPAATGRAAGRRKDAS